jgi:hypothetical protein
MNDVLLADSSFLSAADGIRMIGTAIARALEKTCKVRSRVADEGSEQRGSYYKVTGAWEKDPLRTGETPEAGSPNKLAHKENFNGFGCPE